MKFNSDELSLLSLIFTMAAGLPYPDTLYTPGTLGDQDRLITSDSYSNFLKILKIKASGHTKYIQGFKNIGTGLGYGNLLLPAYKFPFSCANTEKIFMISLCCKNRVSDASEPPGTRSTPSP